MSYSFTLTDADGAEHTYEIMARHAAEPGFALMAEVGALVSGPLAALMAGLAVGKAGADLGGLLAPVGPELGRALLSLRDLALVKRILAHTLRDGKPLVGSPAAAANFNAAFQGNYAELLQAVWEVVSYNRFLPLPATMRSALTGILAGAARGPGMSSGPPPSA